MDPGFHVLVVDDEERRLGPLALRLIRSGFDVLYALYADEGRLLMAQADTRVRALVVSPAIAPEAVAALLEEGSAPPEGGLQTGVVVGPEPEPGARARLRGAGAGWALFEPFHDAELRFVLNTAAALPSELAPRKEARAPANSFAWVRIGSTRCFGVLYSVSALGAFIEMPRPLPKGTRFELQFDVEGESYEVAAEVIYQNAPGDAGAANLPCGMGVVFSGLAAAAEERLRTWCTRQAARYVL